MKKFMDVVATLLAEELKEFMTLEEVQANLVVNKESEKGDIAFPCFKLAKAMRKSPVMIASELKEKIHSDLFRLEAVQGYLNFFIDREHLAKDIIEEVLEKGKEYGKGEPKKENVIVEYCSANISKHMQVGYIRGLMHGSSLLRISKFLGYNTTAINHLGDYGINFGMIMSAYFRWSSREQVKEGGVGELQRIYRKFRKEEENDPTLMEEARRWFKKLEEEKDPEALELWQFFKDTSLKEYGKVWDKLQSHFDSFAGEAFYSDMMPEVRQELIDKGLIMIDDGAEIVDLSDENLPNIVVTTSAGTSLYITRDIAAARYRKKTYDFSKCYYVVGSEQRLHFMQLKAVLKKMGYEWYKDITHVDHGLIMLEGGGKMSSREGEVTLLDDVLTKSTEKMLSIIDEKNPDLENKETIASQVGIGAIAYKELSTSRIKDYVFNWEEALSFEGETGPYLQYTNARCHSLLRKGKIEKIDYSKLTDDYSYELIRELSQFEEAVQSAYDRIEAMVVSRYVMDVAKTFNKFYQNVTILSDDPVEASSKLALVKATSQVLENGMYLINMDAPEQM
ncbi:arginine--tRNA ligase [Guggenheimella bovis]